jgi:hypothetical protein
MQRGRLREGEWDRERERKMMDPGPVVRLLHRGLGLFFFFTTLEPRVE